MKLNPSHLSPKPAGVKTLIPILLRKIYFREFLQRTHISRDPEDEVNTTLDNCLSNGGDDRLFKCVQIINQTHLDK